MATQLDPEQAEADGREAYEDSYAHSEATALLKLSGAPGQSIAKVRADILISDADAAGLRRIIDDFYLERLRTYRITVLEKFDRLVSDEAARTRILADAERDRIRAAHINRRWVQMRVEREERERQITTKPPSKKADWDEA